MKRQITSFIILFALLVSLFPKDTVLASQGVSLSAGKITIVQGASKEVKVKNTKKKVKWIIISGKKYISLKKKGTKAVVISGKSAGSAKVQARVGKKKLTCSIVVKGKREPVPEATKRPVAPSDQSLQFTEFSADDMSAGLVVHAEEVKGEKKIAFIMTNTNKEMIDELEMTVIFKDAQGNAAGFSGFTMNAIAPGETVVETCYNRSVGLGEVVAFKVAKNTTWEKFYYVNLSSQLDVSVAQGVSTRYLDVTMKNNTNLGEEEYLQYEVDILLYDADGKLVAAHVSWPESGQPDGTLTEQIDLGYNREVPQYTSIKYYVHAYYSNFEYD